MLTPPNPPTPSEKKVKNFTQLEGWNAQRSRHCTQVTKNTEHAGDTQSAEKIAQGSEPEGAGIKRLKLFNTITCATRRP